ncbi:MAG TPA: hypothetical protein P5307_01225 [Pirellulaceae bacterium]|nr:hypothetical protein [Planctomycetales bacterium]MCB9938955.1 hypothetical protein [Planctomycetaceae bacterium]HRX77645.1 hypothetical protein [Pirellulaceae bacterium]
MSASGSKSVPSVGFLTVQEFTDLGLIGGYLILNAVGRPLEFHCTAPVRPNRAQEILYGPTLAPFLYGEQIGQTLVAKGKSRPMFVCTNVEPVLSAREFVSVPFVLLTDGGSGANNQRRLDGAHAATPAPKSRALVPFQLAGSQAAVAEEHARDREKIVEQWQPHAEAMDLLEPFSRLREAIEEAQRGAART